MDPTYVIEFRDHKFFDQLVQADHLEMIERYLDVALTHQDNRISILAKEPYASKARDVLKMLYKKIQESKSITHADIEAACKFQAKYDTILKTPKRSIDARSVHQEKYIRSIQENDIVFGVGPAGTGKTYLAVAAAVEMLFHKRVKRLILTRPAMEAGEHLGFLPGDIKDKVDPYLRPLYDALRDMLPDLETRIHTGEIEIAPLAFMRGRTLNEACVILDEAQNTTQQQMKMFLTRLGQHCKMIITGDLTQIDLPFGVESGLQHAIEVLKDIEEIKISYFDETDVMRHTLVSKIIQAYDHKKDQ